MREEAAGAISRSCPWSALLLPVARFRTKPTTRRVRVRCVQCGIGFERIGQEGDVHGTVLVPCFAIADQIGKNVGRCLSGATTL